MINERVVLVGLDPRPIRAAGRWGEPTNYWYVPEPGYISKDLWADLQRFQEPLTTSIEVSIQGNNNDLLKKVETVYKAVKSKMALNPEGTSLWQFSAQSTRGNYDFRMTIECGVNDVQDPIIEWGWQEKLAFAWYRVVVWKRNKWRKPAPLDWDDD